MSKYVELNIEDLKAADTNPRMDLRELDELSESIKHFGIIQPLVVRKSGKSYTIIAGHRRAAAAQIAGMSKVPCVVRTAAAGEDLVAHLIENTQRDALLPAEIGVSVYGALKNKTITQRDLCKIMGRSEAWVSKFKLIGKAAEKVGLENADEQGNPNIAGTVFETETDAEKLYNKSRAILGLSEPKDEAPSDSESTGEEGEGAKAELEVIAELKAMMAAKIGVPASTIEVIPTGKTGYEVRIKFKNEKAARATFAVEKQLILGISGAVASNGGQVPN